MTTLLLVNPASGGGGSEDRLPAIEAALRNRGIEYIIRRTAPGGGTRELIADCLKTRPDLSRVAVTGGDGTASDTAAALAGITLPMGIIPLGTGNDFARGIGLPRGRDVDAWVDIIANGAPNPIDMGRYRTGTAEGCFLNVASTGFDAAVTRAALRLKKRINLPFIYLLAIPAALPALGFSRVTLDVDGIRLKRRVLMVAVANGGRYGGGIRINPAGAPDDGFFDLVTYRAASPVKLVATLPRFLRGDHRRMDQVETMRCRSVRIDGETPLPVNIDGEIKGTTPLAASIVPGGLTLLMPPPGGDTRRGVP
jgi:diacylglycerol kinase (ATP)